MEKAEAQDGTNAGVLVVQQEHIEQRGSDTDSALEPPKKLGPDGKTLLIPQPSDDPEGTTASPTFIRLKLTKAN